MFAWGVAGPKFGLVRFRLLRPLRVLWVLWGLSALRAVVLSGLSFFAMALRLAQFSCGLQLCWAAGGITVLALRFACR